MFCPNCGNQLADNALFCANCGTAISTPAQASPVKEAPAAPVAEAAPAAPAAEATPKANPNKKRNLTIAGIAAAVILVIILCFVFLGGGDHGSPEDVAEAYMDACISGNAADAVDLVHKDIVEIYREDEDMSKSEWQQMLEEASEEAKASMEMIKQLGGSISYEVGDVNSVSSDELAEIQEMYEDFDIKVTDAKEVECVIKMSVMGSTQNNTDTILVVKISGKWYLNAEFLEEFV